jgi:ADP-ribose pyrophosphatase
MSLAKVLSSHVAYNGSHVRVREDTVIEPSGRQCRREIVVHPGAVCIVARPSVEDVILIRQYRHAAGQELLEIPAGTLHDGEDPRECAIRELEEEAGYYAATMTERARFWTTPGFTTEFMYLYEAQDLTKTQVHPDEDEVIEVEIVSRSEALRLIREGRLRDAKSILGLLHIFCKDLR